MSILAGIVVAALGVVLIVIAADGGEEAGQSHLSSAEAEYLAYVRDTSFSGGTGGSAVSGTDEDLLAAGQEACRYLRENARWVDGESYAFGEERSQAALYLAGLYDISLT
ncbi:hypothetical protein ACFVHA_28905, partial [Bacillus cereus]|uniref:hypothetical protein n=1 Tax=Bacillus cereus TaxID=1396 RepID=UPI00362A0B95